MNKITLPERLYYPLNKAAEKLGCDVDDIIHYGAIGKIDICARVSSFGSADEMRFFKNEEPVSQQGSISDTYFNIITSDLPGESRGYLVGGFLYLNAEALQSLELCETYSTNHVNCYASDDDDDLMILCNSIDIDIHSLYIKTIDMRKFEERCGANTEISDVVANNQASMIKSLLAIHYGEDVANSPRRFIENKDSEICKDFEIKGISLPAGKTVAEWIKDAVIDFTS